MAGPVRIVKDPNILRGHPVIEGTRLAVWLIQEHVANGFSEDDILKCHPHITPEGIAAALRYAEEHRMVPFEDFEEWDKMSGIHRRGEIGKADSTASAEE